jgi:hypothetical protein
MVYSGVMLSRSRYTVPSAWLAILSMTNDFRLKKLRSMPPWMSEPRGTNGNSPWCIATQFPADFANDDIIDQLTASQKRIWISMHDQCNGYRENCEDIRPCRTYKSGESAKHVKLQNDANQEERGGNGNKSCGEKRASAIGKRKIDKSQRYFVHEDR